MDQIELQIDGETVEEKPASVSDSKYAMLSVVMNITSIFVVWLFVDESLLKTARTT